MDFRFSYFFPTYIELSGNAFSIGGRYIKIKIDASGVWGLKTGGWWLVSIRFLPVMGGDHVDDLFLFVNLIEELPISHAITPSIRGEVFEFFDVGSKMRLFSELRVDVAQQF